LLKKNNELNIERANSKKMEETIKILRLDMKDLQESSKRLSITNANLLSSTPSELNEFADRALPGMNEPKAVQFKVDLKDLTQESLDIFDSIYNYCRKKRIEPKRIFREAIYLKEFGTKTNNTSLYQLEVVDCQEFYNCLKKYGLTKTNATIDNLTDFLKIEHKPEFYRWDKLRLVCEKIYKLKKEKWGEDEKMNLDMSFSSRIEDNFLGHEYDDDAKYWDGLHFRLSKIKDTNGNSLLDAVTKFEKRVKISFNPPPAELIPTEKDKKKGKDAIPTRAFQQWMQDKITNCWYQGDWNKSGKRDGKGMEIDNDHLTIGYYLDGIIHGQCTTYFCDGSKAILRFK
jgi:hypothetical protein